MKRLLFGEWGNGSLTTSAYLSATFAFSAVKKSNRKDAETQRINQLIPNSGFLPFIFR